MQGLGQEQGQQGQGPPACFFKGCARGEGPQPRRPKPHGPTLHPSLRLPLVLSSVLRVVSLPLVVPTLPIVRRYGDVG